MNRLRYCLLRCLMAAVAASLLLDFASAASPAASSPAQPEKEKGLPAVRWSEDNPGCTFSRSEDGKFRYGLWSGDVGVTLAVDSEELEKVHRRHEPFFGALLDVRSRGQGSLDLATENITLEFVKHFRVAQRALDPDDFAQKVQDDADTVDHEAAREIQKHPKKKNEQEAYVRAYQKDAAELLEFVSKNSLRPATLKSERNETSGWVLFSASSKWISGWKKQEEFILRVPIDGKVFEFPFQLPPRPGDIMLRRRE